MFQTLNQNQEITFDNGMTCKVISFIGGGAQGEVYKVILNEDGKEYALKWYFARNDDLNHKKNLKKLTELEAPSTNFLWPLAFAEGKKNSIKAFGYLMGLRPNNYFGINHLFNRKVEPTFKILITACFNMANAYFLLHSRGFAYKDISDQNVFFNPKNGDVLICDNDNATYDGTKSVIGGTPRYMAPEIVIGKANPSKLTDLYSLATLMFMMLYINHPLNGENESKIHALDPLAMKRLYGENPIFIFDPDNSENRPHPIYHQNAIIYWSLYPKFINDLFIDAFTKGLRDPNARIVESVWRKNLIQLRDSILFCQNCGVEIFYDNSVLQQKNNLQCWNDRCSSEVTLPYRIKIDKSVIMLNHDTILFPHHTENRLYEFEKPTTQVSIHPTKKIWGLKNLSDQTWSLTTPALKIIDVPPGKTAPLSNGAKINFGVKEGVIRY